MDSSSEEDIVKKKGWALVNKKGSIENSSDEEQVENVASSKSTLDLPSCQDIFTEPEAAEEEGAAHNQNLRLAPLSFQLPPPESPTLQTPGSNSSSGSTLVSSLPSPQPHLHTNLPNKVEEDLSSVVDILKSKVEKEDSQSVDSFEILSEPASGDGEHLPDSYSEDGDDEDTFAPLPTQNITHRFTSDSDSDFVRLKAPSEMDSAHSGVEEIPQEPSSQSSKSISSSPEPVLPLKQRPVNAPYEDMRGVSSGEELDHVRIMSRRWPTEDGGFLLVQRFKKLEPDDISTVSSSISDFSSFSMMGNSGRQRLISDTQEEGGDSDTESEVSNSSYMSEEPLPVNMMVQNVPPAIRQYLHKRNDVFNSKLTIFSVLVLTAGLTLGIGHFVGSSQMVSHHESVQEGQKLRLRSLQDELVSCMERRKEISRLYQDKEKEIHHCMKEKEELVNKISSSRDGVNSLTMGDPLGDDLQELRLCSSCREVGLRYSKFCNTRCPTDSMDGHSWVSMDMTSPSMPQSWVNFVSERQEIEAGEFASSQSSPHLVDGVDHKMQSQTSLEGMRSPSAYFHEDAEAPSAHSSLFNELIQDVAVHSSSVNEESEVLLVHSPALSEESEILSDHSSSLNEVIQDMPGHSVSLSEEDGETVSAHHVSLGKTQEGAKVEPSSGGSGKGISGDAVIDTLTEDTTLQPTIIGDTFREETSLESDVSNTDNTLKMQEYGVDSDGSTLDRFSADIVGSDLPDFEEGGNTPRSVGEDLMQANDLAIDTTLDSAAKWVCVDGLDLEHCQNWIPKADMQMLLEDSREQEIAGEVGEGTECEDGDGQVQHLDALEPVPVDGKVGGVSEISEGENLEAEEEEREGDVSKENEGWIFKENDGWVPADSKGEPVGENRIEESADEIQDVQEDDFHVITHALQSAWGIVENASRSIIGKNVSLKDASDIVNEHVQGLKEVVGDAWDSVQTVASQVNEDHIQPVVKKVNKYVKRRLSGAGTGRSGRGKSCKGRRNNCHRHGNTNDKRGRRTHMQKRGGGRVGRRNDHAKIGKNVKVRNQPVPVESKIVEEEKNQRGKNMKNERPTQAQKKEAMVTPNKGNKKSVKLAVPKDVQVSKHDSPLSAPSDSSDKAIGRNVGDINTKESKVHPLPTRTTEEGVEKRNIPESGKVGAKTAPPVLNIEKVLDSMDMSCGGEVRCVENHKIDAARLLKEMISYRQWLWEQRFRKDVDEVEDFMEELEEFIDEEDVDDEDIEDLKDEFEDMVEDIQKTTKKFFRKQERRTRQKASDPGRPSAVKKAKGKQSAERRVQGEEEELVGKDAEKSKKRVERQNKKNKKKKDKTAKEEVKKNVDEDKPNNKGTSATETVHTVMFNPNELPSVQMQNSSQHTMSMSDDEDEQNNVEGISPEAVVSSPVRGEAKRVFHERKQVGGGYINTDEWFFRRAHDRQRRRKENPDASRYFERFHSWDEERERSSSNDWYFQRGRSREDSRDCTTQPWHCEWAHDKSVVTLWEMYKWLTERFAFRADLRAWELEDQINWFLRKP